MRNHYRIPLVILQWVKCDDFVNQNLSNTQKIMSLENHGKLENLYLQNNQISTIEGLGNMNLTNLFRLELGENQITEIDFEFLTKYEGTDLNSINLNNNKITKIKGPDSRYSSNY